MSNVILCHGKLAEKPYMVVGLSINVYSIEELCYLIAQNAHTLDSDFMDERLCVFLDEQLHMKQLALKLREILKRCGGLGEFVVTILSESDYCDEVEIKSIKQILIESAGLSPARKHKSRADNLLKARKFAKAIDEYLGTLQRIDKDAEPLLYAAVLHNMGVAYGKLLHYKKASEYFIEAYRLNMDDESLILHLVCCSMFMKKEQYDRMIIRCGYNERILSLVDEKVMTKNEYLNSDNKYAKELATLKNLKSLGKISQYYLKVDETLDAWKKEYRENMIL